MASKADYYETLGVDRRASSGEIKRSFRRLARELHPDVNGSDPEAEVKFKAAAEAYEVLSDPRRRQAYDRFGHEGLRSAGLGPDVAGFGGIEEIFQAFFGGDPFGATASRGPTVGGDVGVMVDLDVSEVVEGVAKEVSFAAARPCAACAGEGAEPGSEVVECDQCAGSGQTQRVVRGIFGRVSTASVCEACGGRGRRPEKPCAECRGVGVVAGERTWEVDVPPGVEDGQRIRITGAGHAGAMGAPDGDLYVEVRITDDTRFARRGTELYVRAEVPVTVALAGGEVEIPTLEGAHAIQIEAGTQQGADIELPGLGFPPLGGGSRGSLHAVVDLRVQTGLDAEQLEAVRKLDREIG